MTDLIVQHALILPIAGRRIIHDGAVAVSEGRIEAIGKTDEIRRHFKADEIVDASKKFMMPGIINAHSHVGSAFVKGLTEDREGGFYKIGLPVSHFVTPEDIYYHSILGLIETTKFGSTCINEQWHYMDETAKVVESMGTRAVISETVFETDYMRMREKDWSRVAGKGEATLAKNVELIKKWHGKADGRILCRIGTHAPDTLEPELLIKAKEIAQKYNVGLHIHCAQSRAEIEYINKRYGVGSVEFLESIGFLGPDVIAAHLAWINDKEVAILKKRGVHMAHCPVIMAKRGQFPPMQSIYSAGVNVAIGTDWLSMDPWDNMRAAIFISRVLSQKVSTLDAVRALEMATINGARALHLESTLGTLEVGKKADFILVDLKTAHLYPMHDQYEDVVSNIVYNVNGNDVDSVYVDGKPVVINHKCIRYNEEEAIERAQKSAEDLWARAKVFD